ncbi:hypothetical protein EB796_015491 [Bugula neritina]|uniref:G-protein coupled receptors family 1 profile domain-containing protein n=1 Tax=Bugula neritina TaxID=10212 RepID=A0A7J7JIQ4_BUGNE|nr:hypothetical protein EB796_015491 [Bugula neritina]
MVYVNVSDLPYLVMQSDVYLDSCIADICGDTRRNVTLSELKKLNVIYFWMQGLLMTVVCVVGIITNILNIMTLIRCFKLILYKIFLGMAFADLCHMVSLLIYSTTWGAYTYQLPGFETSFTTISNWCSVLLVSFKLFGVMLPLKARIYLNSKRTHIALAAVYISSLAIHSPSWILHS